MANIAKNIRQLRTAQNMTQDQLAESLHVTRQTVSNYETGKSQPDIDTIVRLAEALCADPNTLIYGIPTPPERKWEYVKGTAAAVTAMLAIAVLLQRGTLEQIKLGIFRYPLWAYQMFAEPVCYLLLGAALMQLLSLCFGLRPYVQKTVKTVLLTVILLWMGLALVSAVDFLWLHSLYVEGPFDTGTYWSILDVPKLGDLVYRVAVDFRFPTQIFLLPGAALWLFRMNKAR